MTRTIVTVLLVVAAVACGGRTIASLARRGLPSHHDGATGRTGHAGGPGPAGRPGRDPPVGVPACRATDPPCGATAVVVRVVDGDTVILRTAGERERERVRLIGVDAPETWLHHACFGTEATQALRRLLPPGSAVRVVPDVERRDRFGRLLLYLWTPKGEFVNEALIHAGFARAMTVPPDTSHATVLHEAERSARNAHAGLWRSCD